VQLVLSGRGGIIPMAGQPVAHSLACGRGVLALHEVLLTRSGGIANARLIAQTGDHPLVVGLRAHGAECLDLPWTHLSPAVC
jgi:hypothetical protein